MFNFSNISNTFGFINSLILSLKKVNPRFVVLEISCASPLRPPLVTSVMAWTCGSNPDLKIASVDFMKLISMVSLTTSNMP